MKLPIIFLLFAFVAVQCSHTFLGTNVLRPLVYHHSVEYSSKIFQKRVENLHFSLPQHDILNRQSIKGILAYDLKHSEASANVTQGGIGYSFVNLRMKSERGKGLKYDVYIYI